FRPDEATQALREQFGVATLAGFGLTDADIAVPAAGALVRFLKETQTAPADEPQDAGRKGDGASNWRIGLKPSLAHLSPPRLENSADSCSIDAPPPRARETERTTRSGPPEGSLLGLFLAGSGREGASRTPMGKRLLRDWLCRPLADAARIRARQR